MPSLRVRHDPETEANLFLLWMGHILGGNFYLANKLSKPKKLLLPPYFFISCSLLEVPRTINSSNIFWIGPKFSMCRCSSVRCRQSHGCCLLLQASLKFLSSCSDPQWSCCLIDDCAPLSWWSNGGISLVRTTSTKMSLFASWSNKSDIKK